MFGMRSRGRTLLRVGILVLLAGVACLTSRMGRAQEPITFSNRVARIFQKNCQSCHHPGDIAPFSLMDFESARPYADAIRRATEERRMPPWKPVPGFGEFKDARVLSQEEIDVLAQWAHAGAPEGDPAEQPPPLEFTDGWVLGAPDLVISMPVEFTPDQTKEQYRCFTIPTGLTQDQFVAAVDIRPGNRRVVHHVLLFSDSMGFSQALDDAEEGPGYTCFGGPGFLPDFRFAGGWVPGLRARLSDEGTGMLLTSGGRMVMQVHYNPSGAPETDRTEVGIYFARGRINKLIRVLPLINTDFVIPAGEPRHRVTASFTIPRGLDVHVVFIAPHMHLLGREMKVEAVLLDGTTVPLIYINNWDFEWQGIYDYVKAVPLPGGTRVQLEAFYDNSASNLRNPHSPPKDVTWGEATTDEMCIAFIGFTIDLENLAP